MYARRRRRNLLLSSSALALLVGAGMPSAWAASCVHTISSGFDNPAAHTTANVCVQNTSFTGNITNEGTISPSGIALVNGTVSGSISSTGVINGGISLDKHSAITSLSTAIFFGGSKFSGGISNAGTISAPAVGIDIFGIGISTFAGGIANTGTLSAFINGIAVGGAAQSMATLSAFSGGISNGGMITATSRNGIIVGGTATNAFHIFSRSGTISTFAGGISNSGTISSLNANGIVVGGKATFNGLVSILNFSGGVTNSGAIRAGHGVVVGGLAASGGTVSISSFSGGVSNAGIIRAHTGSGIVVGGVAGTGGAVTLSTFSGGITNSGRITAKTSAILVGGAAVGSSAAVTISSFDGGISNSGRILAGGSGIAVGGGALSSGVSVTISTFSGGISNAGRILSRGPGIMVGGTAVGTGASVAISTFSGDITNSGRITSVSADGIFVGGHALSLGTGTSAVVSTFSGDILNTGTIAAAMSGIHVGGTASGTAVAGVSSFVGNVSNAGTIVAGFEGIEVSGVSAFTGDIINSGRIGALFTGISLTNVSTFAGNIWNSGLIVAGSVGIFVCNCATFSGGSIVNTGTIAAATGILVHNFAPVSIFDSGTIVGTSGIAVDLRNASGGNTFTLGPGYDIIGHVLGHGNDTFQLGGTGSDSFDLSSISPTKQYRGFDVFNVVSGTWTVFNIFGQSQTWNVDGGILAGTGNLAAIDVDNGGTLEPGNIGVPGTVMTTRGSLTFQPGATYLINLNDTTASRLDVGTTASLNGTVDGLLAPGNYSDKTTYDILDTTGLHHGPAAITGTFTGFTALNAPGFTGTLTYLPNEVLLNLTAQLGSGGGLNVNQQNAANAVNNFFNNGGTLPAGFFPLFTLTGGNLGNVLSELDGELNSDAERGAFQLMNQFLDLMLDPYVDGRRGGAGAAGGLGFAPDLQASFPSDIALAYDSVLKAPAPSHPSPASGGGSGWGFDQRWSVWGSGFGGTSKADGDPLVGSNTVTASDYGFAAGMDYRISPDTVVGFSLGGGGTGWNLAQGLGTGRSDAFLAGAYGITHWGPAYLAAALGFADHWFTTDRVALGDQISASFMGQSYAARLEEGYRYALPFPASWGGLGWGSVGVTPYAALQTQWFRTPTYSETDLTGGGFGLTYNAMTANDTRGELGARFDDLTTLDGKPLILRGRVAWAHDWVSNPQLSAVFQALPGAAFTVNGAPVPQNAALTTASAELRFTPRWSLTAKFDGALASGSQTYAGTGTLRYTW